MSKHYSVRESERTPGKYQVVIVSSLWGYEGIALPLFDNFDEAMVAAERMQALKAKAGRT